MLADGNMDIYYTVFTNYVHVSNFNNKMFKNPLNNILIICL